MIKEITVPMWDKMQLFCKNISDHQIRFVIHFNKFLDLELLQNAIRTTIENNPIACARYVEHERDAVWEFSKCELDKMFSFYEKKEPDQFIHEAVIEKLNTFTGPQLKLNLIRSKGDSLILNCDHTIADAAGVKYFMYQLAENYCILSQNKTVQIQTYMPHRSLKSLSKKMMFKEKLSVAKVTLSSKKEASTFSRPINLNDLQNPGFKTYTISPAEFEKIKEFGKKYTATVNDMMLAIYFFTLKRIAKNTNKTNRLSYSSDLRPYLDEYDTLSNYSSIHNVDIDNTIDGFIPFLKAISAITKTRKQIKYDLADFPMMAVLFKIMPYKKLKGIFHKEFIKIKEGKLVAPPSLTNIGIIEQKRICFGNISPVKAYMLGTINHPSLLQLAVSTYEKEMILSIGSYYNGENSRFINDFLKKLESTIKSEIV